ncbi:hypothetical protein AAG570_012897 [Ranatra chinensis]|uniref:Transmembrane protein 53 n=1 Tax=Ranatra chinensis TaxID=642074 RepID=A0ABD0Z1F0_9HEMI
MIPALCNFRHFSRISISKNLEFISANDVEIKSKNQNTLQLVSDVPRPVVLILAWMLAERKHLQKYSDIYLKRGYDVLTVNVTPWQLIWPLKGVQLVAGEVLNFLSENKEISPLLLHGFSVGGYVWGEVLVKMNQDLPRFKPIIDKIVGQIWDSAADITELEKGLPLAMFPKNAILRTTLEKYIGYHLRTFYDTATRHYVRASQMYHTTPVRAPALILVCKTDPVGSITSNLKAKESWDSMGMKTYMKCWEESKHVSHLLLHRNEYLETLNSFLTSLDVAMCNDGEKKKQKLQINLF